MGEEFMRLGFIGPLGDDIPSIFPVVAGILLFFFSISTATQRLDERNSYLSLKRAGMDIAYTAMIKGKLSPADFKDMCDSSLKEVAKRNAVYFAVTIQDCCPDISASKKYLPSFLFKTRKDFQLCTNENAISRGVTPKNFINFVHPIAIPSADSPEGPYGPIYYRPGIVNVIIWREKIGET